MRAVRRRRRRGRGLGGGGRTSGAILDFEHEIDGSGGDALYMPGGGSLRPPSHDTVDQRMHYVKQDGRAVFKFAVRKTEEIAHRILERNGLETPISTCSCRTRPTAASSSRPPRSSAWPTKMIINIDKFGNTTAATIPLALNDAVCSGRLKKGDLVLLASVGAGFTVGAVLLRWGF